LVQPVSNVVFPNCDAKLQLIFELCKFLMKKS